jgi:hypothetical protein
MDMGIDSNECGPKMDCDRSNELTTLVDGMADS